MKLSQTQREAPGIDGRAIAAAALGVLLLIALCSGLVRLLATFQHNRTVAVTSRTLQAPALSSTDEIRELARYRAAQKAWLHGYGWLDGAHRYAHVPIERAMQLLLQHPQLARPGSAQGSARRAPGPPNQPSAGPPVPVDVPRAPDQPAPLAPPAGPS